MIKILNSTFIHLTELISLLLDIYFFSNPKKRYYILNIIDTIYFIEYYENKISNINIFLKCIIRTLNRFF